MQIYYLSYLVIDFKKTDVKSNRYGGQSWGCVLKSRGNSLFVTGYDWWDKYLSIWYDQATPIKCLDLVDAIWSTQSGGLAVLLFYVCFFLIPFSKRRQLFIGISEQEAPFYWFFWNGGPILWPFERGGTILLVIWERRTHFMAIWKRRQQEILNVGRV